MNSIPPPTYGYTSPLYLTAYAITAFLAYWAWHDQRYKAGLVKHPFFSRGGNRPRCTAPQQAQSRGHVTQAEVYTAVRRVAVYTHDYDVAQRLLGSTVSANQGKPLEWCVDKTIHDLIRDRR